MSDLSNEDLVCAAVREAFATVSRLSGTEFAQRHIEDIATRIARSLVATPDDSEVDRVARLLIVEWERVEGKPVNVSYVSTFVDMARIVIADRLLAKR
jgi:hypothetical protein